MTNEQIDRHLDKTALTQIVFKPSVMRSVMVLAVRYFLSGEEWPDCIPFQNIVGPNDKNCIGTALKVLAGRGIIKRCEGESDHRRSRQDSRRGGVVWRYKILSPALARAFLRANTEKFEQTQLL